MNTINVKNTNPFVNTHPFVVLPFFMGVVYKARLDIYWYKDELYFTPPFGQVFFLFLNFLLANHEETVEAVQDKRIC